MLAARLFGVRAGAQARVGVTQHPLAVATEMKLRLHEPLIVFVVMKHGAIFFRRIRMLAIAVNLDKFRHRIYFVNKFFARDI